MRLPHIKASSGQLIELAWFAVCAVEADEDVKGMEATVLARRTNLKKALSNRNDASDNLVKTRAHRAGVRLKVQKWLRQVGLQAAAAFDGKKTSLDYKRILPLPPSKIMAQAAKVRLESLGKVLKALVHAGTPAVLKPLAALGQPLVDTLAQHETLVEAARKVVTDRVDDIGVARQAWFTAYKSLEAALTLKFPDDAERVDSYFDQPQVANGTVAAAPVAEPTPA